MPTSDAPASERAPVVLLVDDHLDSLDIYALYLRAMGFTPITARTAEDAFARACADRPAVVVADVTLPGRSGVDLVRQLRADDRTRHAGMIVLTGHGGDELRAAAAAAGCDRFLLKPCLPDELIAGIRELIAGQRQPAVVPG